MAGPESSAASVLLVEDDASLRDLLAAALRLEGWRVVEVADAAGAEEALDADPPDVAVLDVHLGPGPDGLTLARRIRSRHDLPFIFLSDRATIEDRLAGFDTGADDYVAKPFNLAELVARLKVVLERRGRSGEVFSLGPLRIDLPGRRAYLSGTGLELTRREFDLLVTLARQPGRVATKDQLLTQVWGFEAYDQNLVQVHLSRLRRKMGADQSMIRTVRGVGYVLDARVAR